jgi:hypothetical protein
MSVLKKDLGRPKKIESPILWMIVLEIYKRLRQEGMGRNLAILATIKEIKSNYPNEKICQTGVKNILSKYQPEQSFLFEHESSENFKAGVFLVSKEVRLATPEMVILNPSLEGKKVTLYQIKHDDRPDYGKRGHQKARNNLVFGRTKA